MTDEPVPLKELTDTREVLVAAIIGNMPGEHKPFLIGFEHGELDWKLLGLPELAELPAVTWRQQNLGTRTREQRAELVAQLEKVLG